MIAINTNGVMNGVYAVMGQMKERGTGTIVNMSSIAGRKVYDDHTVYCGTKYFVHAISGDPRLSVTIMCGHCNVTRQY